MTKKEAKRLYNRYIKTSKRNYKTFRFQAEGFFDTPQDMEECLEEYIEGRFFAEAKEYGFSENNIEQFLALILRSK